MNNGLGLYVRNRVRLLKLRAKILLPFGRDLKPKRWLFIVGCYNSGTTLLKSILARHPSIGALPDEGVFLTDSLPYPEEYGWTYMWYECIDKMRINSQQAKRIKRQWSLWYPKGMPNLLEKSISNTARIRSLYEHFMPAYFIAIVRNGYSVAKGIQCKSNPKIWNNPFYSDKYPIELCAKQWRVSNEILYRDKNYVNRFMQVYYEDLVDKPELVIHQILQFLEIECSVSVVQAMLKDFNLVNKNSSRLLQLTATDVIKIEDVAREMLIKHGYLN